MIKKLKVEVPLATAFPHQATLLSILQAYKECEDWIFSNYIQTFAARRLTEGPGVEAKLDFFHSLYGDWRYFELRTNPWLQFYKIPVYLLIKTYNSICDFIVDRIDNEEYIWLPVNVSYIKQYGRDGFHVQFIYGYDLDEQVFFCADNYTGKYSFEKVPFLEMELAVRNVTNQVDLDLGTEGVTLLKYYNLQKWNDKFSRYAFNKAKVINDIKEYLLLDDYGMGYRLNDFYTFGIECYDSIIYYWQDSLEKNKNYLDLRAISSFIDHKNIMIKRIEFMISKGVLTDQTFVEKYQKIHQEMMGIRNLVIKTNLTNNFTLGIISKFINKFNECKKSEIGLLTDILMDMGAL
jgi:hypothetical protein